MTRPAIGIDIGGSAIKLGVVSGARLLARRQFAFEPGLSFSEFAGRLALAAEEMRAEAPGSVAAIGMAMPGYVEPETGISVDGAHNVPTLIGQSLPRELNRRTGLPVVARNDGVAATYGELLFGAGKGLDRFVMMTIGTGIGGGLVINGKLVTGGKGEPPELGAIVLDPDGPVNYSALPGTLEAFSSVGGLISAYGEDGVSAATIFARAANGERAAAEAVDSVCRHIAHACGILINALNLQACILGGGVSNAGEQLRELVERHLSGYTWPMLLRNCRVLIAEHRNDAGVLGAAAFAAQYEGPTPGQATPGSRLP